MAITQNGTILVMRTSFDLSGLAMIRETLVPEANDTQYLKSMGPGRSKKSWREIVAAQRRSLQLEGRLLGDRGRVQGRRSLGSRHQQAVLAEDEAELIAIREEDKQTVPGNARLTHCHGN